MITLENMKIVFMGTPDFARIILEKLASVYDTELIITQPDKPTGRKKEIVFNSVKEFATEKKLNTLQPDKIKGNQELLKQLISINPDVIYVAAYGKILPEEIIKIPKYGCINVHASLLPKYRGAAPINWALINGDKKTGITLMKMDVGMDTGDIISKYELNIEQNDNVESLSKKLANLAATKLIDFTKSLIEKRKYESVKQNENEATVAPKIKKENGLIDWKKSSIEINNLIRGCNPWPVAYTNLDKNMIKIFKVNLYGKTTKSPGEIFNDNGKLVVACGEGSIEIIEIQKSGQKKISGRDFLNGIKNIGILNFN